MRQFLKVMNKRTDDLPGIWRPTRYNLWLYERWRNRDVWIWL